MRTKFDIYVFIISHKLRRDILVWKFHLLKLPWLVIIRHFMKILIEPFPFMELPPLTHGVITPTFIEIQLVTAIK